MTDPNTPAPQLFPHGTGTGIILNATGYSDIIQPRNPRLTEAVLEELDTRVAELEGKLKAVREWYATTTADPGYFTIGAGHRRALEEILKEES